jgi:hypothetical protein
MGLRQSFFTVALATIGLSLSPVAANAIGLNTVSSEAELRALLNQPAFVAEGRIGTIALKQGEETESQADFVWSDGEKQPFLLSYDGSTVKYTLGEKTLETKIEGSFNDIFIYAKAVEGSNSVLLDDLLLKGSSVTLSISGITSSGTNNGLSIFQIYDIGESFTLTGNAMLSWANERQNPASLFYQIQVGNVNSPETPPDANQDRSEPIDSPPPTPETSTGMNWFPSPGAGSFCTSP